MKRRSSLIVILLLLSTLAFAKWGQSFISNVGLSNAKGKVGDHFDARITYQIGWFTPLRGGGPITVTQSDVNDPQYQLFGQLPNGVYFDANTGYISGTPTESGEWHVQPAVRNRSGKMFGGNGYWFTTWVTDTNSGLVYSETKTPITIT